MITTARILAFFAATSLMLPVSAMENAPVKATPSDCYVIIYEPGPNWLPGEPLSKQNLADHGAYMHSLAASGQLLLAGPLTTSEGGLVILRAQTLEEAESLMHADPAVTNSQFVGKASRWVPAVGSAKDLLGEIPGKC